MTTVINLFGGSCTGKTTLSDALSGEMRMRGLLVERAHEYIKRWAWEGRAPNRFDQSYIFGKQSKEESRFYDKVDYVITDSPLLLVPFFEEFLVGKQIMKPSVFNFLDFAKECGVTHLNFWLARPEHFDTRGRYETKEKALEIDVKLRTWLEEHKVKLIDLPHDHLARIEKVLKTLEKQRAGKEI